VSGWLQFRKLIDKSVLEVVAREIVIGTPLIEVTQEAQDALVRVWRLANHWGTDVSRVLELLLVPQLEAAENGQ